MMAYVAAVGARSPLGLSSLQVAMCARARKLEPRALPWLDRREQEMAMCFIGGLPKTLYGYHRLIRLAAPALREAATGAQAVLGQGEPDGASSNGAAGAGVAGGGPLDALPLVVCLPEAGRPDDDPRLADGALIAALAEEAALPIDQGLSLVVRAGHAAMGEALVHALAMLDNGAPAVAVGGVDSYYHPEVLRWLDEAYRLSTPEAENGFIPSEAAAWLVLTKAPQPLGLAALETGDEERAGESGDGEGEDEEGAPNLADTLTELMHRAKAAAGTPDWVMHDSNGERHRQNEFNLMRQRQLPYAVPRLGMVTDLGDTGAASGALFTAIAFEWWRAGAAPGALAFMTLCSEGPQRAVIGWRSAMAGGGAA